jgi:hypothetical protein
MHSFRSGGATAAAQNDTPDRLFRIHGRWKSDKAKDGYVLENLQKRLSVSQNLGILICMLTAFFVHRDGHCAFQYLIYFACLIKMNQK